MSFAFPLMGNTIVTAPWRFPMKFFNIVGEGTQTYKIDNTI